MTIFEIQYSRFLFAYGRSIWPMSSWWTVSYDGVRHLVIILRESSVIRKIFSMIYKLRLVVLGIIYDVWMYSPDLDITAWICQYFFCQIRTTFPVWLIIYESNNLKIKYFSNKKKKTKKNRPTWFDKCKCEFFFYHVLALKKQFYRDILPAKTR